MSSKDKLLQSPEKSHLYFFLAGPTKEQSEKLRQSKSKHDREIVELWQEYRLVSIGNSAFGSKTRAKAQGGRDDVRWQWSPTGRFRADTGGASFGLPKDGPFHA